MEGDNSDNAYIKPFGEVRQSKSFEPKRGENAEGRQQMRKDDREWIEEYKKRRGDTSQQLQPQVQLPTKHWYDEYPVEDRRKQLEECIKKRKEYEDYEEPAYQENQLRMQELDQNAEQYEVRKDQGYRYYNKNELNEETAANK